MLILVGEHAPTAQTVDFKFSIVQYCHDVSMKAFTHFTALTMYYKL